MKGTGNSSLLRPPAMLIVCTGVTVIALVLSGVALAGGSEARTPDPSPASAPASVQPDPYPSGSQRVPVAPTATATAARQTSQRARTPASSPVRSGASRPASSSHSSSGGRAAVRRQHRPAKTGIAVASGVGMFAIPDHAAPRLAAFAGQPLSSRRVSVALALAMALFAVASGLFVVGAARRAEA